MAPMSQHSSCLYFPYAGITGTCHCNWHLPPEAFSRYWQDSTRNLKCVPPYLRIWFPIVPHFPHVLYITLTFPRESPWCLIVLTILSQTRFRSWNGISSSCGESIQDQILLKNFPQAAEFLSWLWFPWLWTSHKIWHIQPLEFLF